MIAKKSYFPILILLILAITSCSKNETKLVSSWQSPTYTGTPITHILILGVMGNGLQRHIYEDRFVEFFQQKGIKATASHTLMPKLEDFQDKAKIMKTIALSGADGVFLATLIGRDKFTSMTPLQKKDRFYDFYDRSYRSLRYPEMQEKTDIHLQTAVFLTANKEMIWSGSTESYDPDSGQIILDGNIKIIQEALKGIGLLP